MLVMFEVTNPVERAHTMTKRHVVSEATDLKAILSGDDDFLGTAVRAAIQPELVWGFWCQVNFMECVLFLLRLNRPRRRACDERVEVSIDNGLKGVGSGTPAQALGQRITPFSGLA